MSYVACWCFRGFDGDGATCPDCGGIFEIPADRRRVRLPVDGPQGNEGAVVVGGALELRSHSSAGAPSHRFRRS